MGRFNLDNYETVESRLHRFWEENPNGRVLTQIAYREGNVIAFCAEVYREEVDERPDATGYAEESKGQSGVNQTSHVENCETSAIGRALANLGYATKGKRPSREEMRKAQPACVDVKPDSGKPLVPRDYAKLQEALRATDWNNAQKRALNAAMMEKFAGDGSQSLEALAWAMTQIEASA